MGAAFARAGGAFLASVHRIGEHSLAMVILGGVGSLAGVGWVDCLRYRTTGAWLRLNQRFADRAILLAEKSMVYSSGSVVNSSG
jgi:hypothetical protein